jgi:hypothetical protein
MQMIDNVSLPEEMLQRNPSNENMDMGGGNESDMSESEPPLDEEDLEENDLSEEEADEIEWEQPEEQDKDLSNHPEKDLSI